LLLSQQQQSQRGRVFSCGWKVPAEKIFPDYDIVPGSWYPANTRHQQQKQPQSKSQLLPPPQDITKHDLLLVGMYGTSTCPGPHDLMSEFPGKILFMRAEPIYWTLQSTMTKQYYPRYYQMGAFDYDRWHPRPVSTDDASFRNDNNKVEETREKGNNVIVRRYDQHTMQLLFVTLVLLDHMYQTERWDWIMDPFQRRQNTGQFPGVAYFTKNCVPFRQAAARNISAILPLYYGQGCTVPLPGNVQVLDKPRSNYTQNDRLFHDYKCTCIRCNGPFFLFMCVCVCIYSPVAVGFGFVSHCSGVVVS
jgi:hypothetical protein